MSQCEYYGMSVMLKSKDGVGKIQDYITLLLWMWLHVALFSICLFKIPSQFIR